MGEAESEGCCAAIQQDHVLSVGRRWEKRSQRVVMEVSSKITYFLWADDGEAESEGCCAAIEQDHVLPVCV